MDTWVLLGAALINLITAFLTFKTHMRLINTDSNVLKIEKATNSMKDALVLATSLSSHAAGVTEERARGEQVAADLLIDQRKEAVVVNKTQQI